jgi:arylsulfatase A-like enzyme
MIAIRGRWWAGWLLAVCCGLFPAIDLRGQESKPAAETLHLASLVKESVADSDARTLAGPVPRRDGRRDLLPNIIVINLDDADRDSVEIDFLRSGTYRFLPNIDRLANEGLRFVNMHTPSPLCAPSRASLFTAQYAHKHGFKINDPTTNFCRGVTGGFQHFRDFGGFSSPQLPSLQNEIGVWMKQAGYRTMLVGKYLHNGYEPAVGQTWANITPPGWDDFFPALGSSYFTTIFVKDGLPFALPDANPLLYPVKYRTAVENREANHLIRKHVEERDTPFFMYIAPLAPHRESPNELSFEENEPLKGMVEPRYRSWWTQLRQIRRPDFDEVDFSDKPLVMRNSPPLRNVGNNPATNDVLQTDVDFRRRVLTLRSVDDMVRDLLATLDQLQLTDQTIIMLTSDHGYHLGQNRQIGKKFPFHRCTNVPLFIWGPGYFAPDSVPQQHLLSQIDLGPTILQLAGRPIPPTVQGKSFYPVLIKHYRGDPTAWRPEGILVEHWETNESNIRPVRTAFTSLRLHDEIYTEWSSGDREYYDLAADPFQLSNRGDGLTSAEVAEFQSKIQTLKSEMPEPITSLEQPFFNGDVFRQSAEIKGLAEYKAPLRHVKLTITDVTDPKNEQFWNGSSWTKEYAFVIAQLTRRGHSIADWSYQFSPAATTERKYRVTARAVAMNGDFQSQPTVKQMTIDAEPPFSQITLPKNEELVRYYQKLSLAGWAQDDAGIRAVRMVIRNTKTLKFWNGTAWQDNPTTVIARLNKMQGAANVLWNYDFAPPEDTGRVYVNLRVFNMNNQTDGQTRAIWFNWSK